MEIYIRIYHRKHQFPEIYRKHVFIFLLGHGFISKTKEKIIQNLK